MRTWLVAALAVVALLVAGRPVLALVQASDDLGAPRAGATPVRSVVEQPTRTPGWRSHHENGPPPWASHPRGPRAQGPSRHDLTPEQRARTMARLAQRHATAMRRWAACVRAGRTDCVRPLPPGLAKRSR